MPTVACLQCNSTNRVPQERLSDNPYCGRYGAPLFQGMPVTLTAANFDGPCKMMAHQFEAAARSPEPHVRLGKLDTEAEQQIAGRYGIRGIPTMILFRSGKEIARTSGAMPATQIAQWARSHV